MDDLYLGKTLRRLEAFARQRGVGLDHEWSYAGRPLPGLERIARLATEAIPAATDADLAILHGDFCFSNILYDFRHATIKAIDPRGMDAKGEARLAGDRRYDVAKLCHSVKGKYDFIKADRYALVRDGARGLTLEFPDEAATRCIDEAFSVLHQDGARDDDRTILAIMVHLFLSMLPLHADRPDHQDAMLANALRLFLDLEEAGAALRPWEPTHSLPGRRRRVAEGRASARAASSAA